MIFFATNSDKQLRPFLAQVAHLWLTHTPRSPCTELLQHKYNCTSFSENLCSLWSFFPVELILQLPDRNYSRHLCDSHVNINNWHESSRSSVPYSWCCEKFYLQMKGKRSKSFTPKIFSNLNDSFFEKLESGDRLSYCLGFFSTGYFLKEFHIFSFLLLLNCTFYEGFRKPKQFFPILLWTSHFLLMPPPPTTPMVKRSLEFKGFSPIFLTLSLEIISSLEVEGNRSSKRKKN